MAHQPASSVMQQLKAARSGQDRTGLNDDIPVRQPAHYIILLGLFAVGVVGGCRRRLGVGVVDLLCHRPNFPSPPRPAKFGNLEFGGRRGRSTVFLPCSAVL